MPTCSRSEFSARAVAGPGVRCARSGIARLGLALAAVSLGSGCVDGRVGQPAADADAAAKVRTVLMASTGGAAETGTETAATGTGWGTLKGRFVFAGTPAEAKALAVDKDTEVCSKDGVKLLDRSLLVDPSSKGLANVVLFVRKSSRVKDSAPPEKPLVFDQKQCEFITPVFAARVGQSIDVHNSDPVGHNTNIAGTSFNQLIPAGDGTIFKPDAETGMPTMVTCNIHPWMKAYAVFRKDGYVGVSAADGSFTIPDLPAGETLEFQVWHERSTGPNGALGLAKPDLKWTPKGRFQVKIEADEVKDIGTLEVPAAALGG
jgi:hypothetical protein